MPTAHPSPLFIVGSPRSGTSLLVLALRSAGYFGFNEGNFFGLLEHIHRLTDGYFDTYWNDDPYLMMSQIDRQAFKAGIAGMFKRIVDDANPAAPWLDKSGNAAVIRVIPVLASLWPSAHFVFARRRGIENVVSRVKKFPAVAFENHCKGWADAMAAWRMVRAELPGLACIEVDQQDLIRAPEATAERLGGFLGFSAGQTARLLSVFRQERPEQTAAGTSERVLTLRTTGWPPQQAELFMRHCKAEMDRAGYSFDESYRV